MTRSAAINDTLLIIGYGNDLRRDDGAGRLLAARLAHTWQSNGHRVRFLSVHQLTPELALEMGDVSRVLFVDAAVDDLTAVTLSAIDAAPGTAGLAHNLDPAALMAYAAAIHGHHCFRAWLLTVPGHDFGFGEGLSSETAAHVDAVVVDAACLWRQLQSPIYSLEQPDPARDNDLPTECEIILNYAA